MKIGLPIIERKNLSSSLYGRISITKKEKKKEQNNWKGNEKISDAISMKVLAV